MAVRIKTSSGIRLVPTFEEIGARYDGVLDTLAAGLAGTVNQADLLAHTSNAIVHVTSMERNTWNSKADKLAVTHTTDGLMSVLDKLKLDAIESGAQKNTVASVAGKTGAVTLVKGDVDLGEVDNTSDANKPISTAAQTALENKVDKIAGKQLSTEDYTTEEKTKLGGLPTREILSADLATRLTEANIIAGENTNITRDGNNLTINSTGGSGGTGTTNHAALSNLSYAASGHTGFATSAQGTLATTAYQKPANGIPKTDLASAVQTSLNKADTALQSFIESDPTVPAWAKAATKPTYNYTEITGTPTLSQSDWQQTEAGAIDYIKNKPYVPAPATSTTTLVSGMTGASGIGVSYAREDHTHSMPSQAAVNNAALTLTQNGVTVASTFTANASSPQTYAVVAPDWSAAVGSQSEIKNKPTIPTVYNAALTLRQNDVVVGNTFTANSSTARTYDVVAPDWSLSDTAQGGIKNKPDLSQFLTLPETATANNVAVFTATKFVRDSGKSISSTISGSDAAKEAVIPTAKAVSDYVDVAIQGIGSYQGQFGYYATSLPDILARVPANDGLLSDYWSAIILQGGKVYKYIYTGSAWDSGTEQVAVDGDYAEILILLSHRTGESFASGTITFKDDKINPVRFDVRVDKYAQPDGVSLIFDANGSQTINFAPISVSETGRAPTSSAVALGLNSKQGVLSGNGVVSVTGTTVQYNSELPVSLGGTGSTSFIADSAIVSGATPTAPLKARAISDLSVAEELLADDTLVTAATLINKLPSINNVTPAAAAYKNATDYSIYAPTAAGTLGDLLFSTGAAPAFRSLSALDIPSNFMVSAGSTIVSRNVTTGVWTVSSDDTTYTAGTGVSLVGTTFSANLGSVPTQTAAASTTSAVAARTYAVQPLSTGQLVVNVPWTDTGSKVVTKEASIISGAQLSTVTMSEDISGALSVSVFVGVNDYAGSLISNAKFTVVGANINFTEPLTNTTGSLMWVRATAIISLSGVSSVVLPASTSSTFGGIKTRLDGSVLYISTTAANA